MARGGSRRRRKEISKKSTLDYELVNQNDSNKRRSEQFRSKFRMEDRQNVRLEKL